MNLSAEPHVRAFFIQKNQYLTLEELFFEEENGSVSTTQSVLDDIVNIIT